MPISDDLKIAIVGTGYVGLVTGVCLAEVGFSVTCVDIDKMKLEMLSKGKNPIYEPNLEELLHKNMERLDFTSDYKKAFSDADIIFIGVGTPEKKDGSANLSFVFDVVEQIANVVEKDCVVVVKSTVPIGTNDKVESYFKNHLKHDVRVSVASNPEFLAQGTAVKDTLCPSRIVIGVEDEFAEKRLRTVYENFPAPLLVMNRKSAEMVKYASNDFLALKISYINEIANLCETVGADIEDVTLGMGLDNRIGNKFLKAGIGYGGSCFPKDTKALSWLASFNDKELKTVKAAIEVNEQQKLRLIKKSKKYYSSFSGLTIAVLGLTFKPETDDLREAPSLINIPIFLEDGAKVKAWDPIGMNNFKKIYPNEIEYCESIEDALKDSDICFVFTEWQQIKDIDPETFLIKMRNPIVLDGRNCYQPLVMKESGIKYESIGR